MAGAAGPEYRVQPVGRVWLLQNLPLVFFFKQKTAYEISTWLEFRRVLFRSEDEKERQSRTSPGSSQRFSSSTSSCAVRSRCNGVTEMSRRSNTASQSLPGTCSCACSSPPIQ